MSLKRLLILLVLLAAAVIVLFSVLRSAPPTVPFTRVERQDLVSNLNTNGTVEPEESSALRAEANGVVSRLYAEQGAMVNVGQPVVALDSPLAGTRVEDARAAVQAAEARLQQATAGGPALPRRELEASQRQTALSLATAERELAALQRLQQANAATAEEVRRQQAEVDRLKTQGESLRAQLGALQSPTEEAAAKAALESARAQLATARQSAATSVIRSPLAGMLYELRVKAGAWLNPGDLVGQVGKLSRVRVLVYVDEPELGRVGIGQPVTIRWDAMPDKVWKGTVDALPTRIQALGSRQVGEVVCLIDNAGRELLPGTNVNVEIETARAQSTLVVPKQALRRRLGEDGVWLLQGEAIQWRKVQTGISSLTVTQVRDGLQEGDAVALITDRELSDGMAVSPQFP